MANQGQKRKFDYIDESIQQHSNCWKPECIKEEIIDEDFNTESLQSFEQSSPLTSPPSSSLTVPTKALEKPFNESFVKDAFDLQESDSDENSYSDIASEAELIEDDNDPYDPAWTDQLTPNEKIAFNAKKGFYEQTKCTNPLYYFNQMLGGIDEFLTLLADGTNQYAQQLSKTNKHVSGQIYLKKVTNEEIKVFMGLCLQMSTMKLPSLADYWDEQSHFGFKGFNKKMSLNRFQLLMKILNFEKLNPLEDQETSIDLIADTTSVQSLINFFNVRMETIFTCGQRLVLNDPIVLWKGKLQWSKYFNEKFRRNVLKLHMLNGPNNLILKLLLDADTTDKRSVARNSRLLVQDRVQLALLLLKEKLNIGHTVYVSKYYGSYALGLELYQRQTYCTGYLDNKRYGNSKELVLTPIENNSKSLLITYAAPLMMAKWRRHSKYVYFYSSDCLVIHSRPTLIKKLDFLLKHSSASKENIINYQLSLNRRDVKWCINLIVFIFNLMVFNSFKLYTMHLQPTETPQLFWTYDKYRQEIIKSLLFTANDQSLQTKEMMIEVSQQSSKLDQRDFESNDAAASSSRNNINSAQYKILDVVHMLMVIPPTKARKLKKCRVCHKDGVPTFSNLCCRHCPGLPGLCETPCFQIWHDRLNKRLESAQNIKTITYGSSGEQTVYN